MSSITAAANVRMRRAVVAAATGRRSFCRSNWNLLESAKPGQRGSLTAAAFVVGGSRSLWSTTPAATDRQPLPFAFATSVASVRLYSSTTAWCKEYPPYTLFAMPALSPTMDRGSIASWSKKEGDSFGAGDVLCSIETDKASVDFEAQDDGIVAKILLQGPAAQDVAVGTPICVIVDDVNDVPAFADFALDTNKAPLSLSPSPSAAAAAETVPTAGSAVTETLSTTIAPTAVGGKLMMPAARHLAESKGLNASLLTGSGKGGRITKGDVLQALEAGISLPSLMASVPVATTQPQPIAAATAAPIPTPAAAPTVASSKSSATSTFVSESIAGEYGGSFEDVPNTKMRKIIASRLTESKRDVPHSYISVDVCLDAVLKLRKKLANEMDVKVSVNDFVIRSCALALRDVPEVNGTYNAKTGAVQYRSSIDISVAVATPTGLITPIVFDTDKQGLSAITAKIQDLATRARLGKLAPHEYQGGTFSVSNLGMFGIDEFSAVINPPQAAILAVGGGSRRIVPAPYVDDGRVKSEQPKPKIQTIMTARLSADRRVVDEANAALFLSAFRQYINQPELLLL